MVTIGAALLAIYGYDWVHRVFRWLLYILLPLMAIITIGVIIGKAGGVVSHHSYGFNWTGFMAQLSAAAAYNITYAGYVSDYSRYLPRNTPRGKIIGYVFAGASTPAIWLIALGAWLAIRLGATDGLVGLQTAGNNVFSHLGGVTGVPVGRRAGRDHGHERLRRHADHPGRGGRLPQGHPDAAASG